MAFFGVTVEEISEVKNHTNADRLSIAKVKGMRFQFVIGKNQFSVGDKVLYFPVDSLLPEKILDVLNLSGKLAGSEKNRIKTIRLRDEISQGVVCSVDLFLSKEELNLSSEEITKKLNVIKYEAPIIEITNGILKGLSDELSVYDIEGADRYQDVVDSLLDKEVVVMEKLEGMNFSCGILNNEIVVNQRNYTIVEIEGKEHPYWNVARKFGLIDYLKSQNNIVFYGEFIGQGSAGNIYNLKEQNIRIFDIKRDGNWLNWGEVQSICSELGLLTVPELFIGKLKDYLMDDSIQSKSNGYSLLNVKVRREGIVVKPLIEGNFPKIGRLIIKQRSPNYLANSDA